MPRLLIAVESLRSGIGIVAWNLANSLDHQYEVHILTTEKGFATAKRRLSLHMVRRLRYPFKTMAYSTILRPRISKIIREVSPEVIHSFGVLPWGYVNRSELGMKRIVSPSGSDVYPRQAQPIRLHFVDHALRNSFVACNSKWLSQYVLENYHVRSTVIPTGVDTQIFRPIVNSARGKVVLFVGRLLEKKGILDLAKAARALPEYEFWLAGEGPVKIPALPNIKILGFQSNIAPLYAAATLCAFPAHYENFPNTGLEAMASGKTLVATERGFSEYVQNGEDGLLVKPHDVRALIDSIRYLMENEEIRRRMEQKARKKAKQYDWAAIAKRYEIFYESL